MITAAEARLRVIGAWCVVELIDIELTHAASRDRQIGVDVLIPSFLSGHVKAWRDHRHEIVLYLIQRGWAVDSRLTRTTDDGCEIVSLRTA